MRYRPLDRRNYLRVRGEYFRYWIDGMDSGELPPRARRIRLHRALEWAISGTTSACAENTIPKSYRICYWWNYLRVRGEYLR